jgi:hypothetical protein
MNNNIENQPIFSKAWWLDAVVPGKWGEITVEKGGVIQARFPYLIEKKFGFTLLDMPPLTQTLGPWLRPYPGKYTNRISEEKQLLTELIERLPPFDLFIQNFNYEITNWLPFYWRGFQQTTRYTYVLEDLSDPEKIYHEFAHFKRKNIKRAQNLVEVREDLPVKDFYENHALTLKKQGQKIGYSYDLLCNIYEACRKQNAGKIFYCVDKNENLYSAIFIIWDVYSAYYLISSIDPDYRDSGSATLLVWEALKFCASRTSKFDFEGSMIESVENSFRAFGAIQKPYFQVSKVNALPIKIYQDIGSWFRMIRE